MWCLIKKGNHTDRLGEGLLGGDSEHEAAVEDLKLQGELHSPGHRPWCGAKVAESSSGAAGEKWGRGLKRGQKSGAKWEAKSLLCPWHCTAAGSQGTGTTGSKRCMVVVPRDDAGAMGAEVQSPMA
jgi:hypothetical protein